ncbi:hypothetical protein EUGRSUZ_L02828 [Eucalyptus grandis]|uniref:PGG domain-containing protein n=4 Tax=Eucalyptus grandis TaxID=71139 RepID=A0AAD9T974_EUCGR|nr:hypothetical protein EUGRSUZ_L02828 [Eucalyptus grandis]
MGHDYSIRGFLVKLFMHKGQNDHDQEVYSKTYRNYHLVVATLIAAATFQAGVNPPGGVWQQKTEGKHEVGRAIHGTDPSAFYVFLAFNTLAFSSSMLLIICHTWGFPFFLEVVIAMISMGITYGASVFAITPSYMECQSLLSIAAVPAIVRSLILVCKYVHAKIHNNSKNFHG